jgi:hypothetical protein
MTLKQKVWSGMWAVVVIAHILFPLWTFRIHGQPYAAPKSVRSFVTHPPPNPADMPGDVVIDISSTLFSILGCMLRIWLVYIAFNMARHFAGTGSASPARAYLWTIGVPAFLALMAWSTYGTHTEEADPLYGGGDVVQDFEPTPRQRNHHGMRVFFYFSIPALAGTYIGLRDRRTRKT